MKSPKDSACTRCFAQPGNACGVVPLMFGNVPVYCTERVDAAWQAMADEISAVRALVEKGLPDQTTQAILPLAVLPISPPIDHAYLSAGDTPAASGDRAYKGCFHCGRPRSEHKS